MRLYFADFYVADFTYCQEICQERNEGPLYFVFCFFYHLLLLCWGWWWMDLAAFHHSLPSSFLQLWHSCFSSASSLEQKQKHKHEYEWSDCLATEEDRTIRSLVPNGLENQQFGSQDCTPVFLLVECGNQINTPQLLHLAQRNIAVLHVSHWRRFKYCICR